MTSIRLTAIALIVLGALGLAYGGFTYTKDSETAKIGPLELTVKEEQTVNIPIWLGAGALALGGLLLVYGLRRQ
jgi:hypothetical protein